MLSFIFDKSVCSLQIKIECLRLVNLVVKVEKSHVTFNSKLTLDCLQNITEFEISRWDQKLKEEDYNNLITFIQKCESVKEAR